MKKKLMIILPVILVMIVGIGIGIFLYQKIENKKIVSTITLDINPSIEINLNKKEKVISVNPLNEDAKKIITEDYTNDTIEESLKKITKQVIEKGYTLDGKVTILVSTTGNITSEAIEDTLEKSFKEQNIETTIIKEDISTTAKEKAKEYNISEGKASYIEEILKENEGLTFEELKDKSISELNNIKTEEKKEDTTPEEPKEEEKTETKAETSTKSNTNTSSGNSSSTNKSSTKVTTQPSDPTKEIDKWCAYNKNGNPYGHEKPMMLDSYQLVNKIENYVMEKYNISSTEKFIARGYTTSQEDNRSSYCLAYLVTFVTRDWYKTFIIDSVKGDIIDEITKNVPNLLTEMEAREIALKHYDLTLDDVWDYAEGEARLTLDGMGGNEYYRFSVVLSLKSGDSHYVTLNAVTGQVLIAN